MSMYTSSSVDPQQVHRPETLRDMEQPFKLLAEPRYEAFTS